MGVAGAGKTLVGRTLAAALDWPFLDADDFHPPSNVAKMRSGVALDPADRVAWLDAIRAALARVDRAGRSAVLACSALRQQFRDSLRDGFSDVRFVHLKISRNLARARVTTREDHFMPGSLVDSQFDALEEPADALTIDASRPVDVIVQEIRRELERAI